MPKNDLDGAGDTDLVCLSLGARASFDIVDLDPWHLRVCLQHLQWKQKRASDPQHEG